MIKKLVSSSKDSVIITKKKSSPEPRPLPKKTRKRKKLNKEKWEKLKAKWPIQPGLSRALIESPILQSLLPNHKLQFLASERRLEPNSKQLTNLRKHGAESQWVLKKRDNREPLQWSNSVSKSKSKSNKKHKNQLKNLKPHRTHLFHLLQQKRRPLAWVLDLVRSKRKRNQNKRKYKRRSQTESQGVLPRNTSM